MYPSRPAPIAIPLESFPKGLCGKIAVSLLEVPSSIGFVDLITYISGFLIIYLFTYFSPPLDGMILGYIILVIS